MIKSFAELIAESQEEDAREFHRWRSKRSSKYTGEDCPNCGRSRVMLGKDKKHRCEKCAWCIEDSNYDRDLIF